ncbi:hypothetical protein N7516_009713 [Penicillium verrucosum]|uniref:uncharacterized protein n=1 Tax=Penicillium verrucosum TaxID=60171 RepID=UPI002544ED0E|nr:uncharacterized protein N7516_009713 [Penicillium verrucosum]KAJ5922010.1 hypothetical protein N7516_009713 [Penicillium verrucosum]
MNIRAVWWSTTRVLFTKATAFSKFRKPTIELQHQGVGPSGSQLDAQRRAQVEAPSTSPETKQYILPGVGLGTLLPSPIIHGVYYSIRTTATCQTGANLEVAAASSTRSITRKSTIYISPRPLLGHRPHRYFFTLIVLTESMNGSKMSPCERASDDARENGVGSPWIR